MMRLTTATYTEPLPQPEVGQCPSGYRESGGYCAPMNDRAPAVVPKHGQVRGGQIKHDGQISRYLEGAAK